MRNRSRTTDPAWLHLERLRLAADVLLGEADDLPDTLEAELTLFRDQVEYALLMPR